MLSLSGTSLLAAHGERFTVEDPAVLPPLMPGRDLGAIGRVMRDQDGFWWSLSVKRKTGCKLLIRVKSERAGDGNRTRVLSLGS